MTILALDAGPTQTGFVVWDGERVRDTGTAPNDVMLAYVQDERRKYDLLAIEKVQLYTGASAGESVFGTCRWSGRYEQAAGEPVVYITFPEVRLHLTGASKGNEAAVRLALLDRFGAGAVKRSVKCTGCKGGGQVSARSKWADPLVLGTNGSRCCRCRGSGRLGVDGRFVGVSGHAWSALALAVTAWDREHAPRSRLVFSNDLRDHAGCTPEDPCEARCLNSREVAP